MATLVDITDDPCGKCYRDLLRFAAKHCGQFSLVWNGQLTFDESADRIAEELKPYLISEAMTDKWPGTRLIGHTALVRQYHLTDGALAVLETAESLYCWLAPHRPEDLAFYTTGQCKTWLATISHEHQAWFEDESVTLDEVRQQVLGIAASLLEPLGEI